MVQTWISELIKIEGKKRYYRAFPINAYHPVEHSCPRCNRTIFYRFIQDEEGRRRAVLREQSRIQEKRIASSQILEEL